VLEIAVGKGVPNGLAVYFQPNVWATNCTACKLLNLALTSQAVEEDVSRFPPIALRL
jgi:hypothetical protein